MSYTTLEEPRPQRRRKPVMKPLTAPGLSPCCTQCGRVAVSTRTSSWSVQTLRYAATSLAYLPKTTSTDEEEGVCGLPAVEEGRAWRWQTQSPWCTLDGTAHPAGSRLLLPAGRPTDGELVLYSSGPWETLGLHHVRYPVPWLVKSCLQTGRLCVNSASIVLNWEKPQEHQGDLALSDHTAPLSSRGPAQSRLLSEFQMAGWSAGLPLSLPSTACAPMPPHRTPLPLPQPAPRRESRMTSPVSPAFSLSFTISWDQKRLSSPTSLSGLHFLYLKLWPDPLNLSIGTLKEPMKKFR